MSLPSLTPLIARSGSPPSVDPAAEPWPECLRDAVTAGFSVIVYEGQRRGCSDCRRAAILSVQRSSDSVSVAAAVGGCCNTVSASRYAVGPDVAADGDAGDPEQPGGRPHREPLQPRLHLRARTACPSLGEACSCYDSRAGAGAFRPAGVPRAGGPIGLLNKRPRATPRRWASGTACPRPAARRRWRAHSPRRCGHGSDGSACWPIGWGCMTSWQ